MIKMRVAMILILLAAFGGFGVGYICGNAGMKQRLINEHLRGAVIDMSNNPPDMPIPHKQEQP